MTAVAVTERVQRAPNRNPFRKLPIGPLLEEVERFGWRWGNGEAGRLPEHASDEHDHRPGSIAELARAAGYPVRSVHRWREAGEVPPEAADRLSCALGLHPVLLWPEQWPEVLEVRWRGDSSTW